MISEKAGNGQKFQIFLLNKKFHREIARYKWNGSVDEGHNLPKITAVSSIISEIGKVPTGLAMG